MSDRDPAAADEATRKKWTRDFLRDLKKFQKRWPPSVAVKKVAHPARLEPVEETSGMSSSAAW